MEIAIVFGGFIILAFLFLAGWSYIKWIGTRDWLKRAGRAPLQTYEGLKTTTIAYSKWRSTSSPTLRTRILVNDHFLLILPQRYSLLLFASHLPFVFRRTGPPLVDKIILNKWNAISLHTHTIVLNISYKARLEFLIDTRDEAAKERLYATLKGWEKVRN